jgi:hypothetical protein
MNNDERETMSTPVTHIALDAHDILVRRQMCPVMKTITADYIVFETLPFLDYYLGWSMVRWNITLLDDPDDNACIVVEQWGSTTPAGDTFTEDKDMRSDHEFESLHVALRWVFTERESIINNP